jgi:hypothetical protein
MHFNLFALALAALPLVSAYPIKSNTLNCRSGPSTGNKIVKTYNKGTDIKISCQTTGDSVSGNNLWDKTQDGCYVSDYYVKTGTNGMVAGQCGSTGGGGGGGSGGGSSLGGKISRKEIMARGQYWVNKHIPYSMNRQAPDQQGRKYRTDCSGFVSMALHASSPGYSTVTLGQIATPIKYSNIKAGDLVGTLAAGTGGKYGHVVLFHSWANSAKTRYYTLECKGTDGCVKWTRYVGWKVGPVVAQPYRYKNVVD